MDLLTDLEFRGQIYQNTDSEGLAERLAKGPITAYCGFDPTADSMTVGNLATIMLLCRVQRSGHRAIALVGGGTGLIGDPSGKSEERSLNTGDTVAEWSDNVRGELERFLDFDGSNPALVVNNYDWLGDIQMIDFMRDVGKHMLGNGSGSIVNICSIMGDGANELNVIAYTAAKGALRTLTLQLGCEWADRGVRVNSVSPGFIITEMVRPALEGMGMDKWIASRTPMRRVGEAQEVTNAVMFLASDLSSYITGVDLHVDGGTNAGNGWFQIPPIHYEWNKDTAPMVPSSYEPVMPRPDWYQAMEAGIPGVHYPLPEGLDG